MRAAGLHVAPYHVSVPSFGEWGFVLAKKRPFDAPDRVGVVGLRYLSDDELRAIFVFPRDMEELPVEENRLNDQALVRYYEEEWARWN